MRSGAEALRVAMSRPHIPFSFVGTDDRQRDVGDLMCMRAVLANFDLIPIDGFDTANDGWRISQGKHTDRFPPRGAPVWFPNPDPDSSGHVAIATGKRGVDEVWTTPVWLRKSDRHTTSHLTTIAAMAVQCGNAYAGWTDHIGNNEIDFVAPAGGAFALFQEPVPIPDLEDDMIGAIEQRETPGDPTTLMIAVFGGGIGWVEISPADREPYNRLRAVLNTIADQAGAAEVLPKIPMGVDLNGWNTAKSFFFHPAPSAMDAAGVRNALALDFAAVIEKLTRLADERAHVDLVGRTGLEPVTDGL